MNRKEFLKLPIKERRRILEEQAGKPEIIEHYNSPYKAILEKVAEELARQFGESGWERLPGVDKDIYLAAATEILSLKIEHEGHHYSIGVIHEDVEVPEVPSLYHTLSQWDSKVAYLEAQQEMSEAGWRKTIKKGEQDEQ